MELLKLKITEFKQNEDNYNEYKSKINKIKELLKENKKYESLYKVFDSLDNKNIYLYLLFFQNYEKWINVNFETNNTDININKFLSLMKFLEKNNYTNKNGKKIDIYSLLINWYFYLYIEFIKYFYTVLNPNYHEVNKIRYIFKETNAILVKLYKVNIINTTHIFNLLNFSIFIIETNFEINSYSDKLYKGKNYLLLHGLFFLLQEVSTIIINKVNSNGFGNENDNKIYIQNIFNFMDEFQNNKVINSQLNTMILINNYLIQTFMNRLLDKIDIKIIAKYEPKFQSKLLDFFSHFFKFSYKKSKIYNLFLNSLKQSFINLYNFESYKNKTMHDLFINNFYVKLLKKIFYKKENSYTDIKRPLFDSFYFNGFDSQISLNVQNNTFEKASLFFSFYLIPYKGRKQYPLFLVQKDFDGRKNDLLNIFLKKNEEKANENNLEEEYYLYVSYEGKEKKLNNIPKIRSKTTYFFCICFNLNKLLIKFNNKKEEIFSAEIDKNNKLFAINSISLSFGFYKKRVNVFSGYFGPIVMVRNPKNSKELNEFISSVLKLESNYINFIFLVKNSNYFSLKDIYCQSIINNKLDYKLEKIECLLYLIPETFRFFSDKSRVVNHFPDIDSICKIQRNYNIYNLNTTLIKHEQGITNFIMDNGLSYICLLYEYIYQFIENYLNEDIKENNSYQEDQDIFMKMIVSIFKKTLFIIQKSYNEIIITNFNKNLKQIYMNLFYCLQLISRKNFIIDNLINYFFEIIKYYHNYITNYINKTSLGSEIKDISNERNNNLLKVNLSFINGWIDALLNPEIYNYMNENTLISLFNELSLYFNYIRVNKVLGNMNQNIYNKLLIFIPFLINIYEQTTDTDKNKADNYVSQNVNKINNLKERDIFDSYFKALKSFFENNPSKSENINNLKYTFIFVYDYLSQNNKALDIFYNFINDLIGSNPDLYFNDDNDKEQILSFIKYANKLINNNSENQEKQEVKNEKEIINKKNLFNKLISILTRIIFTKNRIGKIDTIINKFQKLISKIEKTSDLTKTISTEIINIINNILSITNNSNNKITNNKNQKEKTNIIYSLEELKNISKFYYQIFSLILCFLEYPIDNNDKNVNYLNDNEKIVIELLEQIINILKQYINNYNNMGNNNWIIINLDENKNYIDIIYIIINFLKFYHIILFKKLVSQKFIQNFVEVCELCCKSSLIYSTILIDIDEDSDITKTPLEIILDICIFYLTFCSTKFSDNVLNNNINKEVIGEEHRIIYNLLESLLLKKNNNSKDSEKSHTIFYINDYFRLLSSNYPIDGKKRPKNEDIIPNFLKELNNYQNIERALLKEEKYYLNFSTFFILKCTGYKNILTELILKISTNSQQKNVLKYHDVLTLIITIIQKNYIEHELLYSKSKNFFFNSKKLNTSYTPYNEIKKRIEFNFKQKNYSDIETYILRKIYNKNSDNFYNIIYSGCCKNKKQIVHKFSETDKYEPNKKADLRHAFSSTNLIKELQKPSLEKEFSFTKNKNTFLTKSCSIDSQGGTPTEKENSITQDELELELQIEETPTSERNKFSNFSENLYNNNLGINKADSNYSSPLIKNIKRFEQRKKTSISNFSLSDYNELSAKKERICRDFSNLSFLSLESSNSNNNNFTYINYFYEPDEGQINNAKKELMMTVFSIYFFDAFFNNDVFKKMKNYYLQNFDDIQKTTKILDYPSKIKNFNNFLEPCLFLKPYPSFFINKIFPITHEYFNKYMKKNNIKRHEPIMLYKKILPEFNLEEKFDKKCELIKINQSYYGHVIGSRNVNYIIFEQQKYDFYERLSEFKNNNKILNINQKDDLDLNDLFTLTYVNKKPFNKNRKKVKLDDEGKKSLEKRKKYKRKKLIIILFDEIEEILERRFLLMWQAIEIYLKNGKSYFFNFLSNEQSRFIIDIFKNNIITKDKVHEKEFFKTHQKNLTTEWQEGRLSTYEYLLFINKYGSRTFSDVNQYPIFPWLIRKYSIDKETKKINMIIRNFKYPMAAQTEESREIALNRFEDDEENNNKFPTHFGTHYSTSSYIYFFLMREEPYTTLLVKLQGYKQENPDRMFFSLSDTLFVLEAGTDNRECIPDILCKIEQFINLNCSDFGKKNNGLRVDDFNILNDNNPLLEKNTFRVCNYVRFIIDHKILLDAKNISNNINDWIDNIFGVGQLPENNMKKSFNIFRKETYEQKTNLHKKIIRSQNKYKNQEDIIQKIDNKIDLIISFGQTPYQLFYEKHQKNEKKKFIENDEEEDEDFESKFINIFWEKEIKVNTDTLPIFFEINDSIGKVFLIDSNRKLELIGSNYYNINEDPNNHFNFFKLGVLELSHIKFFEKIKIQENSNYFYYIIKPRYSFSSFKELDNINNSNNNEYISYYNSYINNLDKKGLKKVETKTEEFIRFVTCRYMDNSFKVHYILKNKPKKESKILSFICEDFVSSCITLNHNQFLIGLKNGKLIQCSIYKENNEDKIKIDRQIQAHKKSITVIEINYRLGIIITAGEDNYIFIRKIYDFELITPIKIKSKYIITMAKVSPMNFLYIMCFNKKKKKYKSIIFGYTLNGLYFAKSKYAYFDTLDFTKNGNIVTFISRKEIQILSGDTLKNNIINKDDKNMNDIQKKINGASWIKYNYFSRKNDTNPIINKIITFTIIDKIKGGNLIYTLDVTKIKYFE